MKTGFYPGNPRVTTAAYYLGFICLGMATAVLGPTLQGLAQHTGSTLAQISSLFLLSSFGYLLGSFAAGRTYDRTKGHPILSLSLLAIATLTFIIPLTRSLLFLQLLFFIIGAAESFLDVGINALLVWLHGDRVPPFMNGLHAFYGVGTTTAPLIVAAVLSRMGTLNSIYWALTILVLPVGLFILFTNSPSHALISHQAEDRSANSILVLLMVVVFFAFTGAELGFAGWIYTYATSQVYGTPTQAAGINAAFWAAITAGRLLSIPLTVRLRPRQILWVSFCGAIASLLVLVFFSSNQVFLWIGTAGTGLFMGPIFPTLLNEAQSRMQMSGKLTGWFFAGGSLGTMVLPWLIGQLIGPFGPTSVIVTILASTLLAAGTFFILNSTRRTSTALHPMSGR